MAGNFILALNSLTWHRIYQENKALERDNPEIESKFSITYPKIIWTVKVKVT